MADGTEWLISEYNRLTEENENQQRMLVNAGIMTPEMEAVFKAADTDGNGVLDRDEYDRAQELIDAL